MFADLSDMTEKEIRADEREKIAKYLEIHNIDWDGSILVSDRSEFDPEYCGEPYDEFQAQAQLQKILADQVRRL